MNATNQFVSPHPPLTFAAGPGKKNSNFACLISRFNIKSLSVMYYQYITKAVAYHPALRILDAKVGLNVAISLQL